MTLVNEMFEVLRIVGRQSSVDGDLVLYLRICGLLLVSNTVSDNNARNRAMRAGEVDPINLDNMQNRPHRRRREKKLMTMDEVNERFPLTKYKNWVANRASEGLPTSGGVTAPPSRAASVARGRLFHTEAAARRRTGALSDTHAERMFRERTYPKQPQSAWTGIRGMPGRFGASARSNADAKIATQHVLGGHAKHKIDRLQQLVRVRMKATLLPQQADGGQEAPVSAESVCQAVTDLQGMLQVSHQC
ncbi:hypothetical protein DID88_008722 [Monilinia fructigena]|uniref:Uncharacterized protein n=1 Tax=Monilinia fructigena TaxID=38457 RepID=A0A395J771_9HELO|nr:hypothetical protein DID88_008722 [Monilinia fructigena]